MGATMKNHIKPFLYTLAFASLVAVGCDLLTVPLLDKLSSDPDDWTVAVSIEEADADLQLPGAHENFNTGSAEGCPFVSTDGKKFFIASNRDGDMDIWMSTRADESDPWGEPQNVEELNTPSADFCPTLARDGHTFFFASNRPESSDGPGFCGTTPNSDIYTSRLGPNGFSPPEHLGCEVNSEFDEHSPFPMPLPGKGPVLFFSSARPAHGGDAPGDHDIYMSRFRGGSFRAAELVEGVNTEYQDGQPNVRRDGLELFFYSNRPGSNGNDIYSSSRKKASRPWGTPVNLGPNVNGTEVTNETRPSLSWDGHTLYFGSSRSGGGDIYVTTR